jgi:hypothetical protein
MTEVGIVKKIDGELVEVAFHEECQSCEKCGSCLATSKPRRFFAANSRGLALIPGDRVEYSISSSALLPGHGEAAPVVFGLAGVALGFAVNLLLRRGRRQYPEILRVVRP